MLKLRILRESNSWIAVDKPSGFHTHPPENKQIRLHPRWNALGILERQFEQTLYPMHRLDRAASGILLYSRCRENNGFLQSQFSEGKVNKIYFALVRGKFIGDSIFDSPIENERGTPLAALTVARAQFSFALPLPHPQGGDRIFTLVSAEPKTGRFHQIRRHFSRAGFPLVGDSQHGDRKLNREFALLTGCRQLFLRCLSLSFQCPDTGSITQIGGRWSREWHRLFDLAGTCAITTSPFQSPRKLS